MKKLALTNTGWAVVWTLFGVLASALFSLVPLFAGSNTLSTVSGGRVQTSHVNQFSQALNADQYPRNSSGVVTDLAGSLGDLTHRFLKAFVASGGPQAGDVKIRHTYNGLLAACGEGWMLMDGRVINSTNYNTEHGSGHWTTYVVSSPLTGRYLPDMTNKFPQGTASTTASGVGAISSVGNSSNQVNLQHTHTESSLHYHTIPDHNHMWMQATSPSNDDYSFDLGGSITYFSDRQTKNAGKYHFLVQGGATANGALNERGYYTTIKTSFQTNAASGFDLSNSLSTTQSINPWSIQFIYCMRVID